MGKSRQIRQGQEDSCSEPDGDSIEVVMAGTSGTAASDDAAACLLGRLAYRLGYEHHLAAGCSSSDARCLAIAGALELVARLAGRDGARQQEYPADSN